MKEIRKSAKIKDNPNFKKKQFRRKETMNQKEIPRAVMGVFEAMAHKNTKINLVKIGSVDDRSQKIPVGFTVEGGLGISEIKEGVSFNITNAKAGKVNYDLWCTSIIQKILSGNTFQTKNSIYRWEYIKYSTK